MIPGLAVLTVVALLAEVSVMTHVSTPTERERGFEASRYTVEYRDIWVIERAAEILRATGLGRLHQRLPVLLREDWGGDVSPTGSFNPAKRVLHSYRATQKDELMDTKLGPAMAEPELAALIDRLRRSLDTSPQGGGGGAGAAARDALEDLIADLVVARGAAFASNASILLGRTADPMHDYLWPVLCPEQDCAPAASCQSDFPWVPQGCWPFKDHWIGDAIHFVFAHVNIGLCLVIVLGSCVWRCAFNAEFTLTSRLFLSITILRVLRLMFFGCTTLPMINLSCRPRFDGVTSGGACGDFLFSGHGSIVAISICLFWSQRAVAAPRWPLPFLLPLTLLLIFVTFGYTFERWHYTVDVMLGYCVTIPVWVASGYWFGDETVGITKHRFLYFPAALHSLFGNRSRLGPIPAATFVIIFIVIVVFMVSVTGDIFPRLLSGRTESDPLFAGLEGLAIAAVVVCWSVTEETQPRGTPML
jgi:hypothetical protein